MVLQSTYNRTPRTNIVERQEILNKSHEIPFTCILEVHNPYDEAFIDDYIESGILCGFIYEKRS